MLNYFMKSFNIKQLKKKVVKAERNFFIFYLFNFINMTCQASPLFFEAATRWI